MSTPLRLLLSRLPARLHALRVRPSLHSSPHGPTPSRPGSSLVLAGMGERALSTVAAQARTRWSTAAVVAGAVSLAATRDADPEADAKAGRERGDLPSYTRAEVAQHKTTATRIWVTFRDGVYDVTEFAANHPGGEKILLAAGGALEPFWALYGAHKAAHVYEILETLRVGNVAVQDRGTLPPIADPYTLDPDRDEALQVLVQKPFNAQTSPKDLETFLTPTDVFFVRNHHPVPVIDGDKHTMEVVVGGSARLSLSVAELRTKYAKHDVVATIQCAGNRRSELSNVKGLQWNVGAISTARWSGVKLHELLRDAGITEAKPGVYVTFEGVDKDMTGEAYSASITLAEALDPSNNFIVAYEMGGEELTRDHGYPLRIILPGLIGARTVKWLSRISIGPEQAKSFFYQKDYKIIPKGETFESFPAASVAPVMRAELSSVFTWPEADMVIPPGTKRATLKGWAYSGTHAVAKVEVSADGGKTWHTATLTRAPSDSPAGAHPDRADAWVLWHADVPLPSSRPLQLVCRAVDAKGNVQPESQDAVWNLRGIMNNSWHRVTVRGPDSKA